MAKSRLSLVAPTMTRPRTLPPAPPISPEAGLRGE